jgi:hypothetical protein
VAQPPEHDEQQLVAIWSDIQHLGHGEHLSLSTAELLTTKR